MNINVIITGASGMVGEGVLLTCLENPQVQKALVIGRRSCGITHEKLTEILVPDLSDISTIKYPLKGYNACFFCLGTTSVGKTEEEYTRTTHTLTLGFAKTLSEVNPEMTFCYVSGSGTDSTEKGKVMWARVKGKTENDLSKLPFRAVYHFRPGYLHPIPNQKHTLPYYKYISWLYPLLRLLATNFTSTLKELGTAMIAVSTRGYEKKHVEVRDIHALQKLSM
jgi:hypothetical protein